MQALVAAAPLAVILIGMGVLRQSAITAGAVGLALALALALTLFAPQAGAPAGFLTGVAAEAAHSTLTIVWIILPALTIYEFQKASGAITGIRDSLTSLTDDRRQQVLLIAWFFALFMEGAAGFGTPVALAAPLLVGLGYAPLRALVLALLGHAAGVSFGAVGTPILAQVSITGVEGGAIALRAAALHAVAAPFLLLLMVRLAASTPLTGRDLRWTGLAALAFLAPSLGLAATAGPELPTLGGALIGALIFAALLTRRGARAVDGRRLLRDLAPYLVILLLILATRLIPPVQDALRAVVLDWQIGARFSGSFEPLYHPGTMLFAGLILGAVATQRTAFLFGALLAALNRLGPVVLALLIMLALSRVLVHAGMIEAVALAAAGAGTLWPLLAPYLGVLGTFITGSATASNILFTEFQLTAATQLGLPASLMVATQSFGAAIGNIVAPHNIIAGSATVGLNGREGQVLALTALPCLLYAGLGGAIVMLVLS